MNEIEELAWAEGTVEQSEARFRALANNIPQLAWMADHTGYIFWYNQRWFDYTGATSEAMLGWGWQKVHHIDYVEQVKEKFLTHVASGEPWEDTFPLLGSDGIFRWFLSRAFPIRDETGSITLWCGTNTDITEQRRTEAALTRAEGRVRALYELTSRTDFAFEDKVMQLLHIGREWLELSVGTLARTDCDAGVYHLVHINPSVPGLPVGFSCPLDRTFCAETVKRGLDSLPLAVEDVGADDEYGNHPAYKAYHTKAYLAAIVRIDNRVWGTLAFIGNTPRLDPFTDFDKDMVRLMAQWIGGEIARREAEDTTRATAVQQRRFVREMLASVTEGKLCLCDDPRDLPAPLVSASERIALTPVTIRLLRKRVQEVADSLQLSRERTQDLLTAVGEAGMNAVKHGGGGTGQVYADAEKRTMQVFISDTGKGIRQEDLHRATLEKGWSGSGSLGHGFFLMLRTVDRTYLMTGAHGTTVVLEQEAVPPTPTWLDGQ